MQNDSELQARIQNISDKDLALKLKFGKCPSNKVQRIIALPKA